MASQEGLFPLTLVVIHCDDLTFIVLKMYKVAAVISALMKVYSIPCHDRGHINVMLVLQSCTDPLHILPSSSSETFPTSSDGACNFSNIEVEEDMDVKEEGFKAIKEEVDIGIKQEEVPEDITSYIKSEPDEVSYVCVCLLLDTFILMSVLPLETVPLFWGGGVFAVGERSVLDLSASNCRGDENISCLLKNLYPQDDS